MSGGVVWATFLHRYDPAVNADKFYRVFLYEEAQWGGGTVYVAACHYGRDGGNGTVRVLTRSPNLQVARQAYQTKIRQKSKGRNSYSRIADGHLTAPQNYTSSQADVLALSRYTHDHLVTSPVIKAPTGMYVIREEIGVEDLAG